MFSQMLPYIVICIDKDVEQGFNVVNSKDDKDSSNTVVYRQ